MRVPSVLTPAGRLRAGIVLAILVIAWMSPHQALACPSFVDSYTYYNGCGSAPTITGDDWEECNGFSGGWGTVGHWRQRIRSYCVISGVACVEYETVYSYWEYCSGTWVQRTQAQFYNGDCQC